MLKLLLSTKTDRPKRFLLLWVLNTHNIFKGVHVNNITMCLQYHNFNFDANCMQLYPGSQSVSKFRSVKNVVRIYRRTLTWTQHMQQHTTMYMEINTHVHYHMHTLTNTHTHTHILYYILYIIYYILYFIY